MKSTKKWMMAAIVGALFLIWGSVVPRALAAVTWTPWQSCGNSVSVSFSQVDSSIWTWKFRNDGPATITYMDFNYSDSSGQNYDVLPGFLAPGHAFGGWAAFTSTGWPTIELKTLQRGDSVAAPAGGQPTPQLKGSSQPPSANQRNQSMSQSTRQHLANAQAYEAEGEAMSATASAEAAAIFRADLAPYGKWMDLNGQTYWQPNEVGQVGDWRPYSDNGQWVYTEDGWTWDSSYSWGWAPFHYGRWVNDPVLGWLWTPGRVWSPAWVAWRSNDTKCGWAPLPPGTGYRVGFGLCFRGRLVSVGFDFGLGPDDYCFIEVSDLARRDYRPCRLPSHQVVKVFKETTIIETAYVSHNGRLINAGINADRVRAATHFEIRPLKIAEVETSGKHELNGYSLAVYRPITKMGVTARTDHVMDELLGGAKKSPTVAQHTTDRTAELTSKLLDSGHSVHKSIPEPSSGIADAAERLLARGHDMPTHQTALNTHPVTQTAYGSLKPAPSAAQAPSTPTYTPPQPPRQVASGQTYQSQQPARPQAYEPPQRIDPPNPPRNNFEQQANDTRRLELQQRAQEERQRQVEQQAERQRQSEQQAERQRVAQEERQRRAEEQAERQRKAEQQAENQRRLAEQAERLREQQLRKIK